MTDPCYITRDELQLRSPGPLEPLDVPVDTLFVHHSVTTGRHGQDEWRQVQAFHMDSRGYSDIAYNAGISPLACVLEGRSPRVDGAATLGWNNRSLAVCFIGTYTDRGPTDDQLKAAAWVAHLWMLMGLLTVDCMVLGHRDEGLTSCPGDALYARLPDLRRLIAAVPTTQEDDMALARTFIKRDGEDPRVYLTDGLVKRRILTWDKAVALHHDLGGVGDPTVQAWDAGSVNDLVTIGDDPEA